MTRENYIHRIAGTMILVSALCSYFVNINWIWLAIFTGVNLFQYSFTKWCILDKILQSAGIRSEREYGMSGGK